MKKITLSMYLMAVAAACCLAQQNDALRAASGGSPNADDFSQNIVKKTFKGAFSGIKKIVLNLERSVVSVEGYNGNEVIIEAENPPQMPKEAEGLRPLSVGGTDNTGLGVAANVNGTTLVVTTILKPRGTDADSTSTKYRFKIPANMGVVYKQSNVWCDCNDKNPVAISNIDGEVEVKTNDINILLTGVTGPIVAKSNNGKIKVVFDEKMSEKPSSFVTYDGNIDITLSEKAKVVFGINTGFYGSRSNVFTDLDLKAAPKEPDYTERAQDLNAQAQATKAQIDALNTQTAKQQDELKANAATSKSQMEMLKSDKMVQERAIPSIVIPIPPVAAIISKEGVHGAYEPAAWGTDNNSKVNYILNENRTKISIRTNNGNIFLRKK
jgi:hypothetical protein